MITKKSIVLEIISEAGVGKTDFCSKIPNVFLCDLTPTGEGDIIFAKYHEPKYFEDYYMMCSSFKDIEIAIRTLPSDTKTFALDGSQYLIDMAESLWCSEQPKKREAALQREYGELYEMVRTRILYPLIRKPCNIVFTSVLKDTWVNDKRTGERERKGFNPFDVMRDIGIYIYKEEGIRKNMVVKNRFISESVEVNGKQTLNPKYMKTIEPFTWQNLLDMITIEGSAMKKEWLL